MRSLGNTTHRLIKPMPSGAFVLVYEGLRHGSPAIIKVAREAPLDLQVATGPAFASGGVLLQTGSVGQWVPSPNEIILREAEILQRVRHSGLVTLLESGAVQEQGRSTAYLITERIAGRSWRQLLAHGKSPKPHQFLELVRLLTQLKEAGLPFHGDLKPDNILTDAKGNIHVIDPSAGLAAFDQYGHPERLFTTAAYSPSLLGTDVEALGVLMLECLANGRHPLVPVHDTASSREIGPELQLWLQTMAATGRSKMARLYPWMHVPSDHGAVNEQLEGVALRCLGLCLTTDRVLERAESFAGPEQMVPALERAL